MPMRHIDHITAFLLSVIGLAFQGCDQKVSEPNTFSDPAGQLITQSCMGCHSPLNESIPDLTEYSETELFTSLSSYQTDQTGQSVMHRIVTGYTEIELLLIAETFGRNND